MYDAPTLVWLGVDSNGDSTQLGYVNGAVTTNSPWVETRVTKVGGGVVGDDNIPHDPDGEVFFDQVWGRVQSPDGSQFQVSARACTAPASGCDDWVTFEPLVRAHDVAPHVYFPGDTAIEEGSHYLLAVADHSGGRLYALWQGQATEILSRDATYSDLLSRPGFMTDGVGQLRIVRCRDRSLGSGPLTETMVQPCTDFGISQSIEVDRTLSTFGTVLEPTIGAAAGHVTLRLTTLDPGVHRLSWRVTDEEGNTVANNVTTATTAHVGDGTDVADYVLPLPVGLEQGSYRVEGSASRLTPHGNFFSSLDGEPTFTVDAAEPSSGALTTSRTTLYPTPDGFQDTLKVTLTGQVETWDPVTFEVLNAQGDAVRTEDRTDTTPGEATFVWDGRADDARLVPPGQYRFRVTPHDQAGNPGTPRLGDPVTVSTARLVHKTWSTSRTARATLVASSIGRCSRIRRPASHGWAGSLGLQSAIRCKGTAAARRASTTHEMTLPALPKHPDIARGASRYDTISVTTYGGSSHKRARHTATLRYLTAHGSAAATRVLPADIGYHAGVVENAAALVGRDRAFRWSTYVVNGQRYDLRNFIVTVEYTVLQ